MPVFASDIAAMHIGAGGHVTDPNGLISGVLTPCRLGRRSLQQAAMFASARPPCRSSTRTVSLKQSSHDEISCTFTQNISRAVCAGMFLRAKAQRCILAQAAMPPIRMG
jgi:hypothetical protein